MGPEGHDRTDEGRPGAGLGLSVRSVIHLWRDATTGSPSLE